MDGWMKVWQQQPKGQSDRSVDSPAGNLNFLLQAEPVQQSRKAALEPLPSASEPMNSVLSP